ncbi:type IV pilus secretin PilQ [Azonexus sp.]|uniref:type IV pilus secretin PilQ n=1 Tax=Azonexus sp. TaxID=1872668 RepID=UPI0027B98F8A|nr:type IV pilus secretin PilQ [Azonexus sp.]
MKLINHALVIGAACWSLLAPVCAETTPASVPANAIESVNVARQGNEVAVKIDLREGLVSPPAGFAVANPAKIAFDFPLTANALGKTTEVLNQGDLRSMNVVQVADRTRLVLNLVRNMNYTTRIDGKSLYVVLSPIERLSDVAAERSVRFAEESLVGAKHVVRDVVFRRGKDGEGRVVVELGDAGTGIDIRQQGPNLVVDFVKTSVPEHLRRKLDVTDFATPIVGVETRAMGENVRMIISPKGLWEHNAYQTDNQFIVEVKKVIEDPNKLVQGSKVGYQGPRVSINYQNGDVRALLRLMAEELGLNAVISETVTGNTTLVLKDVPADQVIDIIFQQKGLDMRKKGSIIMIAPRDEIATREKLDFESRQQISELEPLVTEQFVLNYQKAVEVAQLLIGAPATGGGSGVINSTQRILSKRGNAVADPQSNILFINDIPSKLDEIRTFIKTIDIGARQVLIEARVVEASDSFLSDIGMKLNFLSSATRRLGSGVNIGGGTYSNPYLNNSSTTSELISTLTGNGTTVTNGFTNQVGSSSTYVAGRQTSSGVTGFNLPTTTERAGTFAFSLFNSSLTNILNLEVSALESDGLGKVISTPRVVTANNVEALIEDGTEVPYWKPASGNDAAKLEFKKAKLSLKVTPQITPDGTVKMLVAVEKAEPDWSRSVQGVPPIKSSIVKSNVIVDNGGTIVVGGVYMNSQENNVDKIPLLGDIPMLGHMFKNTKKKTSRRELLIFITPRIISNISTLN